MPSGHSRRPRRGKDERRKQARGERNRGKEERHEEGRDSRARVGGDEKPARRRGFRSEPFWAAMCGSLLLAAAFPPLGIWPLALLAPAPFVWLVRRPHLRGPRPYLWIWLGASVGWLALLQGVRLPHWLLYFGWIALSMYAASYMAVLVGCCRVMTHHWRCPLILAAPIAWVGLELARGHLLTGFSVGLAGHPLTPWTEMLQIAELGGAYAVSFVVVLAAACLVRMAPCAPASACAWPLIPLVIVLGAAWLYGEYRLKQLPARDWTQGVPVCLLQSNQDVVFVHEPNRQVDLYHQCLDAAETAKDEHPELRLIVWPESTASANRGEVLIDGPPRPPVGMEIQQEQLESSLRWALDQVQTHLRQTAEVVNQDHPIGAYQLLGTQSERFGDHEPERLNTALLIDPQGDVAARYFKAHRVMFGEYVPLGDQLPAIYRWTPMARGLTAGRSPTAFAVDDVVFYPNICFESTVPHLVRRQFRQLAAEGSAPDAMVNVSNDGWFWGSSILDLHFACNTFRAVELRRPVLVSANTGITAWLDDAGRVRRRAERRTPAWLVGRAQPARVARSVYLRVGDVPAAFCLLLVLGAAVDGWRRRRGRGSSGEQAGND